MSAGSSDAKRRGALSFDEQLKAIIRLAALAERHYEVWRVYSNPESRGRHFSVLEEHADFVNLDEQGHRTLCLLYLSTLFETDRRTINLPGVLAKADEHSHAAWHVGEARRMLGRAEEIIKKVKLVRDNAIAHRAAKLTHDEVWQRAAITVDQLAELVRDASAIATALSNVFDIQPFTVAYYAPENLHNLLDAAKPRDRRRDGPMRGPMRRRN